MPKIYDSKPVKTEYQTAPMPEDPREDEAHLVLNLQICTCDHDRCVHTYFLGTGKERRIVLDCPNAGACRVVGCKCRAFTFSDRTSKEGKRRREAERKRCKVVPPER